jgi:hypothetical protein
LQPRLLDLFDLAALVVDNAAEVVFAEQPECELQAGAMPVPSAAHGR